MRLISEPSIVTSAISSFCSSDVITLDGSVVAADSKDVI